MSHKNAQNGNQYINNTLSGQKKEKEKSALSFKDFCDFVLALLNEENLQKSFQLQKITKTRKQNKQTEEGSILRVNPLGRTVIMKVGRVCNLWDSTHSS